MEDDPIIEDVPVTTSEFEECVAYSLISDAEKLKDVRIYVNFELKSYL